MTISHSSNTKPGLPSGHMDGFQAYFQDGSTGSAGENGLDELTSTSRGVRVGVASNATRPPHLGGNRKAGGSVGEPKTPGKPGQGARRYPCPFRRRNPARFNIRDSDACARAWFADNSAVKRHVRIHHRRPDRPFICQCCKEGFLSSAELSEHVKSRCCAWREPGEAAAEGIGRDGFEDGITAAVDGILDDRTPGGGEVHTWDALWRVLFPADGASLDPAFHPIVELPELEQAFEASKPALKASLQSVLRDVVKQQLLSLQASEGGGGGGGSCHDHSEAFSLFLAGSVELAVEAHWHNLVRECGSRAWPLGRTGDNGMRAAWQEAKKAGKHQQQPAARVSWHGKKPSSLSRRRGSVTVFPNGRALQGFSMCSSSTGSDSAPSARGSSGTRLRAGSETSQPGPSSVQSDYGYRSITHDDNVSGQPDGRRLDLDWASPVPDTMPVKESVLGSWLLTGMEQQTQALLPEGAPWNSHRPAGAPLMLHPNAPINIPPKRDASDTDMFSAASFVASPTTMVSSSGASTSSGPDLRGRHYPSDDLGASPTLQACSPKPSDEQRDSGIDLAYDLACRSGSVRGEPRMPMPDSAGRGRAHCFSLAEGPEETVPSAVHSPFKSPLLSDTPLPFAGLPRSPQGSAGSELDLDFDSGLDALAGPESRFDRDMDPQSRRGGRSAAETSGCPSSSRYTLSRLAAGNSAENMRRPRALSKLGPPMVGGPLRRGRGDGFAPDSFRRRISPSP